MRLLFACFKSMNRPVNAFACSVLRKGDAKEIVISDEWPALTLADDEWRVKISNKRLKKFPMPATTRSLMFRYGLSLTGFR
jgi:hypothetical protein